jgi:hypothetical protein
MRRIAYSVLTVAAFAGLGVYAMSDRAGAQGAPPAQVSGDTQTSNPAVGWGRHRWMMSQARFAHQRMEHVRAWGLFAPQADKKLSSSDVQTIAEAMLVRHGNHTWKVANVAQNQDDTVSFAFTTPGGDVIARFAMDTHTGRLRRLG